jgi:membrane-associated protein
VSGAVLLALVRAHARGPRLDYLGVGLAALASWAGIPGPGEAALISGGLLAGRGRLDLVWVIGSAWLGALVGGVAGWLVGLRAGRALASPSGPLAGARRATLARGDRFYARFGFVAVFLTPSWIAGIHRVRASRYLPANALAALVWAVLYGAGGAIVGPSIADLASDLGLVGAIVVAGLVVAGAIAAISARRRRRRRRAA